jgi:hypothetical protein
LVHSFHCYLFKFRFHGQLICSLAAGASANLAEMKKATYSWDQSKFVEKGGWATMPGSTEPNSAVAAACAESLGREKAANLRR